MQAAWADDLAEHTIHSPVWQEGEPDWDPDDYWSDYSDDYYDNVPAPRKNKDSAAEDKAKTTLKRKRTEDVVGSKKRKLDESGNTQVTPAEDRPLVKYRNDFPRSQSPPILEVNGIEKVAILKDWRERFPSDDDGLLREQNVDGAHAQQVTEAVDKKKTDSQSNGSKASQSRLSKSRIQEKVLRKPKSEAKISTVSTKNKANGVTQPDETGPKALQSKFGADTLSNTKALATLPNGHTASRKRKQSDTISQTEENRVDDKSKRQKGVPSNSTRVTKETKSVPATSTTGKRTSTRSGKGGGK